MLTAVWPLASRYVEQHMLSAWTLVKGSGNFLGPKASCHPH